jgi:hypothetical protein
MDGKDQRELKSTIASILFEQAKKKLDPVGKEDGDVDNDGDKDSSDEYLMKRREAIKGAIKGRGKKAKGKKKLLNPVKEDMERHPFDAESGPGEFDVSAVHDHIEDHGGIPLTPENVKKHDIHFTDDKFYDRQETFVNAGKGPLSKTATNMHVFNTPSGEKVHGMFAQPNDFGASAYEQHPHFPGKRVFQSGIFDVIDHHDLPERNTGMRFEGHGYGKKRYDKKKNKKKNYSQKEIQEATVNRIKNIGSGKGGFDSHPGMSRF